MKLSVAEASPQMVCLGRLTVDDLVLPDGRRMPGCTGGNALYATLGARLWQPATEMVAVVGEDLPQQTWKQISAAGFRTDGLRRRPVPTLHNQVTYDEHGGRSWMQFYSEQDSHLLSPSPEDIPPDYLEARIFMVHAMSLEAQERLVTWLRGHAEGLIALDLREAMIPGNEKRIEKLVSKVDFFLPSQEEALLLAGSRDWPQVARRFASWGPREVAIKRGADGAGIYSAQDGRWYETPAYPVDVVDATGAGDAFCGGFLAMALRQPGQWGTCLRAGAVSASFAIAGYGTMCLAAASREEAEQRLGNWTWSFQP